MAEKFQEDTFEKELESVNRSSEIQELQSLLCEVQDIVQNTELDVNEFEVFQKEIHTLKDSILAFQKLGQEKQKAEFSFLQEKIQNIKQEIWVQKQDLSSLEKGIRSSS